MNQIFTYDLTFSKDKVDRDKIKTFFKQVAKKWCFQEEKGEKTGYMHYQCRVSLKVKQRLSTFQKDVKEFFGWENVCPKTVSITNNESKSNDWYAMKSETRVAGPWKDTDEELYIPRQVREIENLRPWQQSVVDTLGQWDPRTINVVIDRVGNNGKSVLVSWVRCFKLGRILPALNDAKDLMRATYDMPTSGAYLIDLPRALDKRRMNEMYSAIEQIKSGYCYDDRYNFREKVFDCPQIWIFTNAEPDQHLLSADRWKLWSIKDEGLVQYTPVDEESDDDF